MVYSTPVHQLIVSNIKSMDLNTVTTVPKMISNVVVCCHRITINYESNSTTVFLPFCKKASECCADNN